MKKTFLLLCCAFLVSAQETPQEIQPPKDLQQPQETPQETQSPQELQQPQETPQQAQATQPQQAQTQPTTRSILNLFGSIGVGFKTGGQLFTSETEALNGSGEIIVTKEEDEFFNYGQGFKMDFGAQYLAMENLGLQADIEISLGAPGFETNDRLIDTAGAPYDSSTKYTRNMYGIKFMVVPRFEVLELLNMYTGVGLGYFWNSLHYEISRSDQTGTTTEKGRIVSSPTLGFTGLIGADYPISDIVSIFGEIAFDQVSFRWKKQIVESTNIKDHKIGTSFFEEDDPSNPAPLKVPGSNWQIRIGARFNIL